MASEKLKKFIDENIPWSGDDIGDNEIVTEAIIMYRAVVVDADGDELPERTGYTTSRSCGLTMAVGIAYQVQSQWEYEFIKRVDEEDQDGEE